MAIVEVEVIYSFNADNDKIIILIDDDAKRQYGEGSIEIDRCQDALGH